MPFYTVVLACVDMILTGERISGKEDAAAIAAACEGGTVTVQAVERQEKSEKAPALTASYLSVEHEVRNTHEAETAAPEDSAPLHVSGGTPPVPVLPSTREATQEEIGASLQNWNRDIKSLLFWPIGKKRGKRSDALVQMATGAGKSFTAITATYRLLKFGKMNRILFLVDTRSLV